MHSGQIGETAELTAFGIQQIQSGEIIFHTARSNEKALRPHRTGKGGKRQHPRPLGMRFRRQQANETGITI